MGTAFSTIAGLGVIITGILLTIGLIRPGFVVWWNKSNSRKQVFMIWGGLLMVFSVMYFLSATTEDDSRKENDQGNTEIETHSQDDVKE